MSMDRLEGRVDYTVQIGVEEGEEGDHDPEEVVAEERTAKEVFRQMSRSKHPDSWEGHPTFVLPRSLHQRSVWLVFLVDALFQLAPTEVGHVLAVYILQILAVEATLALRHVHIHIRLHQHPDNRRVHIHDLVCHHHHHSSPFHVVDY